MTEPLNIGGLELDGGLDTDDIVTAAVLIVELISAETSRPYLRVMSSDTPLWRRVGMLRTILATDEFDGARAFEPDDE